ncbi:unnamed protein product [Paramecium sonneborni]|uniref:Uncharacterized protein n=1 Tax=Paramecium sonneborni TaxID=65129 RepID=A0A8S1Q2K9_9CILI|nr:unnamed protein product [Paramecium sonneborni]
MNMKIAFITTIIWDIISIITLLIWINDQDISALKSILDQCKPYKLLFHIKYITSNENLHSQIPSKGIILLQSHSSVPKVNLSPHIGVHLLIFSSHPSTSQALHYSFSY